MSGIFLSLTPDGVRLRVRLQPRASYNRLVGQHGDAVKAQVTAPPVEGEANEALGRLLADLTDLPRSAVRVVAGAKSRVKVVELRTHDAASLAARLDALIGNLEANARLGHPERSPERSR